MGERVSLEGKNWHMARYRHPNEAALKDARDLRELYERKAQLVEARKTSNDPEWIDWQIAGIDAEIEMFAPTSPTRS
jgi:hypothetical protein